MMLTELLMMKIPVNKLIKMPPAFVPSCMDRVLVRVGSTGSFEPMDFWKLVNLIYHYSKKKEFRVQNS